MSEIDQQENGLPESPDRPVSSEGLCTAGMRNAETPPTEVNNGISDIYKKVVVAKSDGLRIVEPGIRPRFRQGV